jgi:tryptophanyl-tRNA synthetase
MEEQKQAKQRILSGIQPTGVFTLGNYMGAIVNWEQMQEDYDCAYFIADLHSLTVRQEPAQLRKHTTEAFALLLACGIDPEKSLVFVQSHVHTHAEMGWILCCSALMGDLGRMTQFKDKSAKHADNINAGLFTYPVLMAGDILLYQADYVPVGQDQRQHLEFTRDLAERFNHFYGNVFKIPDGYYPKAGAKVMSLQDPTSKMSKSDPNPNSFISILDDRPVILNKFKRAVTDSETGRCVYFDPEKKPGVANLMQIYSACTGKTFEEIETEFDGKGYGAFKPAVGEAVVELLRPIREEAEHILRDKAYLEGIYRDGAERASRVAERTLRKVYKKVGLVQR